MIDYKAKTLTLFGKTEPVKEYAVGWRTPFGLFAHADTDKAVQLCEENQMNVQFCMTPVTLAVTESGLYEEIPR